MAPFECAGLTEAFGIIKTAPTLQFLQGNQPMPSFDIVSEVNKVELKNALEQANKEVSTRFDFKGSDARIEQNELQLTLYADDDFKLKQVTDVFQGKCAKRGVDLRALDPKEVEKISGNKVKQVVEVKNGIETELAKRIG